MKVTNEEIKYSQLQINFEGSMQEDSAEHESNAGAYASSKITGNNITNGFEVNDRLLEKIMDKENVRVALKRVISNKGSHGIDGMKVDELRAYLNENWITLKQSVMDGKFRPNPARRVEILKEDGIKKRKLGIPTTIDRVIQQAIAQILSPMYEVQFSDSSYGFRPNRSAHQAIRKCQQYIQEGYNYAVDMDLEKYFDTIDHSKLIEILSRTIKDGRVISLIHKYLRAGVVIGGTFEETIEGVMQGGPLSPLLGNVMLNELDKVLEARGHRFARYADDLMIYCKSKRSAMRIMDNTVSFVEKKLFLKVNREKTKVDLVWKLKFLGFSFYKTKGEVRVRIHPKSIIKMRAKVKVLTGRSYGLSNEERPIKLRRYIMGWINYFKIADIKSLLKTVDQWMRRRIRMVYWKQWKKVRTRLSQLISLGIEKSKAWEFANTRKGYWRISNSPIMSRSLTNDTLKKRNYIFFSDYYNHVKFVN
ncbi:group II intron reverse transcriptase/maturase [Clostridium lacusfryxellense]|uniref:group II intron reverse transcriptase/maturase n=1 Tax=Clostridium lacusfryxellense TaxID=205328 RepID=UPI001C0B788E|nr:group II intron reverse transcriptase/maturase [Clostridium lacusfryxellense]MBU3114846.1 group II intron reverse transcriptase/maturase [Clostridium lacusfryxellense]